MFAKFRAEVKKRRRRTLNDGQYEVKAAAWTATSTSSDNKDLYRGWEGCLLVNIPNYSGAGESQPGEDQLHFKPFEEPPLPSGGLPGKVKALRLRFTWRDQGWGNKKGTIIVKLVRPTEMAAEESDTVAEWRSPIAEHHSVAMDLVLKSDKEDIVAKAQEGDKYEIWRLVGGGGGHQLFWTDFSMMVLFEDGLPASYRTPEMQLDVRFQTQALHCTPLEQLQARDCSDEPLFWFKTDPLPGHVSFLRVMLNWQDQGWGNRKGRIRLCLMRYGECIAMQDPICGIAEHHQKSIQILFTDSGKGLSSKEQTTSSNDDDASTSLVNTVVRIYYPRHDVLVKSQRGDYLAVYYVVGGGGGHSLTANINMSILLDKAFREAVAAVVVCHQKAQSTIRSSASSAFSPAAVVPFGHLPNELVIHIISFLSPLDFCE
ncbi:hypothetical protein QOT17_016345 [Balamuthia mandrillaris]